MGNGNDETQSQNPLITRWQGVIQGIFEIGNSFWAHKDWCPNFDKLTKNNVFTEPLISKHRAKHIFPPMYIKHCKPVF